jgi:uncharacterized protein (DUF952 family)/GNAT superfamily N-acetyltransferase
VLLHLTTPATWRVALAAGSVVTPSLLVDGFIHLSSAEQVHLPADRLFAGRDDTLLLVLDEQRFDADIRWEPGIPTDPASMRFPHLYGPLPVAAVTSVVPYRPGPDGYGSPVVPSPADPVARAIAFDRSLALRRAAATFEVGCGVAVLDPRVPSSYEHNAFWVGGAVPLPDVLADANRALAGCAHRRVVLDRPPAGELPDAWDVEEERVMVLDPEGDVPVPAGVPVQRVPSAVMAESWARSWRRTLPGISDASVLDLVRREAFADVHLQVVDLAVLGEDGVPVSSTQLRVDGATAAVEAVMTDPSVRVRGYAGACVATAIATARAAGCDVIWLLAVADDWPRHWYARLGFVDVGARWVLQRR